MYNRFRDHRVAGMVWRTRLLATLVCVMLVFVCATTIFSGSPTLDRARCPGRPALARRKKPGHPAERGEAYASHACILQRYALARFCRPVKFDMAPVYRRPGLQVIMGQSCHACLHRFRATWLSNCRYAPGFQFLGLAALPGLRVANRNRAFHVA